MNTFKILISALAITLTGSTVAQAQTYSPAAIDSLRFMIEEEKLAGDVYRTFGALYPTIKPFQNIPRSEDSHVTSLLAEANAVGLNVTDLTSLPAGQFQNASLQSLYHSLIAQGSTSSFAALTVGKNIEVIDINDLAAARALVPSTSSLYTVYGNLTNASNNHLRAFNNWLAMTPPPPVPEPETYAMLLAGLGIVGAVARRRQRTAC
ncbi:MAG: hypothetical protein H6R14_675 [Proteobacteria bacterium]|nr:hypothetical protein [Pseudomonadota bacterium]